MAVLKLSNQRIIGDSYQPYIIAEVNSSHGGKYDTAIDMIDAAKECGCDCVKFQSWSSNSLYSKTYYDENPIARRFVVKFSLSPEQLKSLSEYTRRKGLGFSSTPYSFDEVDFLVESCEVPFIKIASMELNNDSFLKYIAKTGKPLVLSTGMGTAEEVDHAVNVIKQAGNTSLCLLHCISIYPCEPIDVNLNNILWLKETYPECVIGFSDHSIGMELSTAAIALGARIIEKHLTLDKKMIGMDNQMATEPDDFKILVSQCRNVFKAMGSKNRIVSDTELEQRTKMRRSLIYTDSFPKGHVISESDLSSKRPGTGFPPNDLDKVVGRVLVREVLGDTLVTEKDFTK